MARGKGEMKKKRTEQKIWKSYHNFNTEYSLE